MTQTFDYLILSILLLAAIFFLASSSHADMQACERYVSYDICAAAIMR